MFQKLFTFNPSAEKPAPIRPRKGVIIGVGQVGLACAYSLLIQDCFDELILHDVCLGLPTVVNEKGILKTVNLALSEAEAEQLRNSAQVLRKVFAQLKL